MADSHDTTALPKTSNPERLEALLASFTTALANLDASILAATALAAAVRRELGAQDRRTAL